MDLWYHVHDIIKRWYHNLWYHMSKLWYHMSNHDIRGTKVPDVPARARERCWPCTSCPKPSWLDELVSPGPWPCYRVCGAFISWRALGAGSGQPGSVAPAMLFKTAVDTAVTDDVLPRGSARPTTAFPVCRTPPRLVVARSFPRPSRTRAATAF